MASRPPPLWASADPRPPSSSSSPSLFPLAPIKPLPSLVDVKPRFLPRFDPLQFSDAPIRSGFGDALVRPVLPRQGFDRVAVHHREVAKPDPILPVSSYPYETKAGRGAKQRARAPSLRRREQCRANQARYRERQNRKFREAEEHVACLREQINLLELRRSLSAKRAGRAELARQVVVEYFRRFRNGLAGATFDAPLFPESVSQQSSSIERNPGCAKQVAFVRTIVSADADMDGVLRGPDALLEQWWRYSSLHSHVHLELVDVQPLTPTEPDRERLRVTSRLAMVVSEHTLAELFPHLEGSRLYRQLLGKALRYSLQSLVEFQATSPTELQVTRVDSQFDMVPGLLDALGSIEDAEFVMRGARISPHGFLGDLSHDHPGAKGWSDGYYE